ncbi:MAG: hypothetical protein ABIH23_32535, partial [bacterium]
MPNQPQQFSAGFASRNRTGPPRFLPGVLSTEEANRTREHVLINRARPVPQPPPIPRGIEWILGLIKYGADQISQVLVKYGIEDLRKTVLYVKRPAYLDPTADGHPFDILNGIAVPVPVPNGAGWQTIAQYTVPAMHQAILSWVGHDVSNAIAWPVFQWRILVGSVG